MQACISRVLSAFQLATALSLALFLTSGGWAQEAANPPAAPSAQSQTVSQPFTMKDYAKPRSHFPNPIAPYSPRYVEQPNLSNTSRIDQLVRDGKLYISMNDAVALALENNLDIAIARYNFK